MAKDYDYPSYDAGGRVEQYKEGGKVEDKELKDRARLRKMDKDMPLKGGKKRITTEELIERHAKGKISKIPKATNPHRKRIMSEKLRKEARKEVENLDNPRLRKKTEESIKKISGWKEKTKGYKKKK